MNTLDLTCDAVQHFPSTMPEVLVDRVLRIQGYPDLDKVRKRVREATEHAVERSLGCIRPAAAWRVVPVTQVDANALVLDNSARFEAPIFERFLANASHAVAAVFTIGDAFDDAVNDALASDNLLEGVLMENAGWLAVEGVTKQFTQALRKSALDSGFSLSQRLSPGYEYQHGDSRVMWDLAQQAALFSLFGNHTMPVRLLESSAMLPKMSRSGLIGLRPLG